MRLVIGVPLSIALGVVTYAAPALTNDGFPGDPARQPRLAQADAAQNGQSRQAGAESDAISLLAKRVAQLERRVDALEAKNRSATPAVPQIGPRGWIVY
ncbi:MAG TPA: hypothetical protein VGI14_19180 [Casimicrobiaceae bacterium]